MIEIKVRLLVDEKNAIDVINSVSKYGELLYAKKFQGYKSLVGENYSKRQKNLNDRFFNFLKEKLSDGEKTTSELYHYTRFKNFPFSRRTLLRRLTELALLGDLILERKGTPFRNYWRLNEVKNDTDDQC